MKKNTKIYGLGFIIAILIGMYGAMESYWGIIPLIILWFILADLINNRFDV